MVVTSSGRVVPAGHQARGGFGGDTCSEPSPFPPRCLLTLALFLCGSGTGGFRGGRALVLGGWAALGLGRLRWWLGRPLRCSCFALLRRGRRCPGRLLFPLPWHRSMGGGVQGKGGEVWGGKGGEVFLDSCGFRALNARIVRALTTFVRDSVLFVRAVIFQQMQSCAG